MERRGLSAQRHHIEEKMIKQQSGFTITELMIAMAVFIFAITAMTNIFVPVLTQFKQHSKIAETQIEGVVGLDILRRDLEQAGFGLPWVIPAAVTYQEGSSTTTGSLPAPNNAFLNDAASNPPRALASVNSDSAPDYLVIKATSVAVNNAAMKWTRVVGESGGAHTTKVWGSSVEDPDATDRVIVLIPSRGLVNQRILVNSGSSFYTQLGDSGFSNFSPTTENDIYLIYGVDSSTNLTRPFNRADYYLETNTTMPPRCAAGTGILMKSVINQAGGDRAPGIPLLDCVADFQVIFILDRNSDGNLSATNILNDLSGTALTAQQIRQQVKEVRVYILAHEGQKDITYTYPNSSIAIPAAPASGVYTDPGYGAGRTFNFSSSGITDWQNYRWKLYRIVAKPNNLVS
jgi:prepilin-type N-terminal cleavage/methylation domain-containing protein